MVYLLVLKKARTVYSLKAYAFRTLIYVCMFVIKSVLQLCGQILYIIWFDTLGMYQSTKTYLLTTYCIPNDEGIKKRILDIFSTQRDNPVPSVLFTPYAYLLMDRTATLDPFN